MSKGIAELCIGIYITMVMYLLLGEFWRALVCAVMLYVIFKIVFAQK